MLPVFKKVGYPYVATVLVKALGGFISVAGISGTSPTSSSISASSPQRMQSRPGEVTYNPVCSPMVPKSVPQFVAGMKIQGSFRA